MGTNIMTPDASLQGTDDISKAARKRGRAYRCHRCFHKDGRNYIEVKCRVEAHILRDHLRRDEVPHYCSLCQFRCLRREDLEDHLVKYKRHRVLAQQSGVDPDDTTCLKSNPAPYTIDEKDFSVLDREASFKHWVETLENRKRAQDPLNQAVNEIFPGGIPADLDYQEEEEEEPLPNVSKQQSQTVVSLDGQTLKATLAPLLEKLSTIADTQTLRTLLGDQVKEQEMRIEVMPEEEKSETEKINETATAESEMGTAQKETNREREEENLMPQLLPQEDQVLTPKRKRAGTLIPNKRMRSESPSSRSESTYDSGSESSDEDRELKKELLTEMRSTREALQRNTRVLQSLEESILTLASAMTAVAKANSKSNTVEEQAEQDDKRQTKEAENRVEANKQTHSTNNQHTSQANDKDRKDRKREHSRERRDERYNERKHERHDRDRKDEKQRRRSHSDTRRDRHYRR